MGDYRDDLVFISVLIREGAMEGLNMVPTRDPHIEAIFGPIGIGPDHMAENILAHGPGRSRGARSPSRRERGLRSTISGRRVAEA